MTDHVTTPLNFSGGKFEVNLKKVLQKPYLVFLVLAALNVTGNISKICFEQMSIFFGDN